MKMDDFKKLATGNVLFNLSRIISPKLVTILYFLGLAAIVLWAVTHFFAAFRFGFGSGLWGLLEIAVFGLLALVVLRIACEAVIVYFRAHADTTEEYAPMRGHGSLIDEVREAIEDLADDESDAAAPTPVTPAPTRNPGSPTPDAAAAESLHKT